ncbi:MAG: NIPSNAP family protein, partial [Pseudomonadota bacterium]
GDAPILRLSEHPDAIVEEQVISLHPGAMPDYWDVYRQLAPAATSEMPGGLLGGFRTLLGEQYKILILRWYENPSQLLAARADLRTNPHWHEFEDAVKPFVSAQHTQLLAPWAIPQMAPIFY